MVDDFPEAVEVFLAEVVGPYLRINIRFFQNLQACRRADTVNVSQSHADVLVPGYINACNTRHYLPPLCAGPVA